MDKFIKNFPFSPSKDQENAFIGLEAFLKSNDPYSIYILKGYAGTGKTTLVGSLVKTLPSFGLKTVLLAPTGRAAKVLANYSGKQALTIHKKIYRQGRSSDNSTYFKKIENKHTNTVFIVDEASMISNQSMESGNLKFGNEGLLSDLLSYVYESNTNCKVIFVGDSAQLPPIGQPESPALSQKFLEDYYQIKVFSYELTEVLRQAQHSGILVNATELREKLLMDAGETKGITFPQITTKKFKDIYSIKGDKLEDGIHYAHKKFGIENTLILTRTNKVANIYNQHIRNRILFYEEEISSGDYLMVVKNNYFWLPEESTAGFIANGDIIRIKKIKKIEEMYGHRFANITIEFLDYPNEPELTCKIMLDTISSENASLNFEQGKLFYEKVMEEYAHVKSKKEKAQLIKENPYYNALQVKFAYAITCHKAQGGQWDIVFVDHGYLREDMINQEFYRWLYTSFTRASKELYLVNFDKKFLENHEDN